MITRAMIWFFGGSIFAFVALLCGQGGFSVTIFVTSCIASFISGWATAVQDSEA